MIDVKYFIFDEPKDRGRLVIDEILESISNVFVELGEENFGFFIC